MKLLTLSAGDLGPFSIGNLLGKFADEATILFLSIPEDVEMAKEIKSERGAGTANMGE